MIEAMSLIWLDNRSGGKKHSTAAIEHGYDAIWASPNKVNETKSLGEISVIGKEGGILPISQEELQGSEEELLEQDREVAVELVVESKKDEEFAKELGSLVDYLVVRTTDWDIIPLENLIASLMKEDVKIIVGINDPEEAETALKTLEKGSDGVLLKPGSLEDVVELSNLIMGLEEIEVDLTVAEIKEVKELGMGDRVCVDTTSLLELGEGMLVGSSSSALFLVHSESIDSEYADPRPFRVNAGGVHNYIQVSGGETRYLSEIGAGDPVLVVDKDGGTREVFVGRAKIEKRPMMLVEASVGDEVFSVVLQNAETIRLVNKDGEAVSIADLEPGDQVVIKLEEGGRHFGEKISETIYEK